MPANGTEGPELVDSYHLPTRLPRMIAAGSPAFHREASP